MAVSINQEKIKELLLAKGDKIALGIGGGLGVLLLGWGAMAAISAPSPAETVKALEGGAKSIQQGVAGDGEPAPPLPEWVAKQGELKPIDPTLFATRGREFEPVFKPNMLRETPQVVVVEKAQLDVVRLPYKAFDIQDVDGVRKLGVLKERKADAKDFNAIRKAMEDVNNRIQGKAPKSNRPTTRPNPQQPPGGMAGMGGPGGRGGMSGMGGPGGRGGMSGMGGPGGMGGMSGMGGMGEGGGMMGGPGTRTDASVEYVYPDEVAKNNYVVAQSVAPLRAVMVHGLINYKAQLDEYQRALKIPPLFAKDGSGKRDYSNVPPPQFAGFDVQRRVIAPGGQPTDWEDYDHIERFFTEVRARAVAFSREDGYFGKFFRYEDQIVTPLPVVADDLAKYPSLRMKEIDDAVEAMRKAGVQPVTPSDWERRLAGRPGERENPLDPRSALGGGEQGSFGGMGPGSPDGMMGGGMGMGRGSSGQQGRPGAMPGGNDTGRGSSGQQGRPGAMPGGPGGLGDDSGRGSMGQQGGRSRPGMGPGGSAGDGGMGLAPGGGGATYAQPETDYLLLRFLDIDARPGFTYQYRVRLKLRNPNYGMKTGIARKADAGMEVIEGRWSTLPEQITLPAETQLYAISPEKYQEDFKTFHEAHGKEYQLKRLAEVEALDAGRRAVVQLQQWQPEVGLSGTQKKEPIGTWVVVNMPVAPGEYIGRRTLVELPLWSAGLANYVLRELAGGVKVWGIKDPKNQPKGWPINFRTPLVLADFDGGREVYVSGGRQVTDDAAEELLIVRPDGKLMVRNSADDMADKGREERNKTWDDWLKRVSTRSQATTEPSGPGGRGQPGGGGNFGRP